MASARAHRPHTPRSNAPASLAARNKTAQDIADEVLARRCLTVFGPTGAGKSSLLQNVLVPHLTEVWDLRVVVVNRWAPERPPAEQLAEAIAAQLGLGVLPHADLILAVQRAARRSDRPMLLVLDQIEQLLDPRTGAEVEVFLASLAEACATRWVQMNVVWALREDSLGRWMDLLAKNRPFSHPFYRVAPQRVRRMGGPQISQGSGASL